MIPADLLIANAAGIATCRGPAPRAGAAQRDIGYVTDADIAASNGTIVFVGDRGERERTVRLSRDAQVLDAAGCTIAPGFVDPHTHAVYAGDRANELRERLAGVSYASIAARGGGIVATVAATRRATEEELEAQSRRRLDEMLACGTTTCEIKSGYGLDTPSELKQLRVIRQLAADHPIDVVATFMGAHEVPLDYRGRRSEYVDLVIREMIPAVAAAGLAEWCDVFCEEGVFTPEESRAILQAGTAAGLRPRIHADELAPSGGSRVAAEVGARSADHLLFIDDRGINALRRAGVVATLLPIAAFYLKAGRYAPARRLIDAGVPVALATDLNPGAGFSPSMPFAITLACFAMQMTFEEALVAATLNAAFALDRHDRAGSLEAGKPLDAVVIKGELVDLLRVGVSAINLVLKNGRIIHSQD